MGAQPLRDLRVVDLTSNVAGPFATMILADLGAEVIKIERPVRGDDTRSWGPPFRDGESMSFSALNRNKRSFALDLKSPSGMETLHRLIKRSDILVENLTLGPLRRLGLDYEAVRAIRPDIIYCEMTGYGSRGPMSERPAYDAMMQAFSGLMSITGEPGRTPVRIPVSVLDQGTGMWAAIAILSALRRRDQTGEGALLETSLLHTALMWMPAQILGYLATGEPPSRNGSGLSAIVPYQAFEASDGYLVIAASNDRLFEKLCRAVGQRDLAEDPRFATNAARVENRKVLIDQLAGIIRACSVASWIDRLGKVGVPVAAVRDLDSVLDDPQVVESKILQYADHPTQKAYPYLTLPAVIDGTVQPLRGVPPKIGQHTAGILADLGYTDAEVRRLHEEGAIGMLGD